MKQLPFFFLLFLSFSIKAEPNTYLECKGNTEVALQAQNVFPKNTFVSDSESVIQVVISGKKIIVNATIEFSDRPNFLNQDTDADDFSSVEVTDTHYDAVTFYENGKTPSKSGVEKGKKNYLYVRQRIFIDRQTGQFFYHETLFLPYVKDSELSKKTKSNLKSGYFMKSVEGVCKRVALKRLF